MIPYCFVSDSVPLFSSYNATVLFLWMSKWQQPVSLLTQRPPLSFCRIWWFLGHWVFLGLDHLTSTARVIGSSLLSLGPIHKQLLVVPDDWCYPAVLLLWWVLMIRVWEFLWRPIVSKKLIYLRSLLLSQAFTKWGFQL